MHKLINICISGCYIIHMVCSHQYQMATWKFLLMVSLKNKSFLSCYCKCRYVNSIKAWQVHLNMLALKRQRTNKTILSFYNSSIQNVFHPKAIICIPITRLFVCVSVVYLQKACIPPCSHVEIVTSGTKIPNSESSQQKFRWNVNHIMILIKCCNSSCYSHT